MIRDERAMDTNQSRRRRWEKKQIAVAQEFFAAHGIQNRSRIDAGSYLKRDAGGKVGFDQPGNYIYRRTLGRKNEMNARGARLLRQPGNVFLDIPADRHHKVRQFIDNDHDSRQPLVHQWRGLGKIATHGCRFFSFVRLHQIDHASFAASFLFQDAIIVVDVAR